MDASLLHVIELHGPNRPLRRDLAKWNTTAEKRSLHRMILDGLLLLQWPMEDMCETG